MKDAVFSSFAYHCMSKGVYRIDGKEYAPVGDLRTEARFKEYLDCGFDIFFMQNITYHGEPFADSALKGYMDAVERAGGKKIIVFDYRLSLLAKRSEPLIQENGVVPKLRFCLDEETRDTLSKAVFPSEESLYGYICECVKEYSKHSAFYGILLVDEPAYSAFENVGTVYRCLKRVLKEAYIHCNLWPMAENVIDRYAESYTDIKDAYSQYLDGFVKAVGVDYLQYDNYPLMEKDGKAKIDKYHLQALQLTAEYCKANHLDFYFVAQSMAMCFKGKRVYRPVSRADMLWQVYHLLGFGVQRIAFYTYFVKHENRANGEFYPDGTAMIDRTGNKTDLYYAVQDILHGVQSIYPKLSSFRYAHSTYALNGLDGLQTDYFTQMEQQTLSGVKEISCEQDSAFLCTELTSGTERMYFVQNCGDTVYHFLEKRCTLRFKNVQSVEIFNFNASKTQTLEAGELSVVLFPGDAVFILPKKE